MEILTLISQTKNINNISIFLNVVIEPSTSLSIYLLPLPTLFIKQTLYHHQITYCMLNDIN